MDPNQFNYQPSYYYIPNQSPPNSENSQNQQYYKYVSPKPTPTCGGLGLIHPMWSHLPVM